MLISAFSMLASAADIEATVENQSFENMTVGEAPNVDGWNTANYDKGIASVEVKLGDRNLKMSEGEYYIGENTDEELSVHLWGPSDGWKGENMVVVFKVSNVVKKILVVTPPSL